MVAKYIVVDPRLGPGMQLIRITSGRQAGLELALLSRDLPGVTRLADLLGEEAVRTLDGDHPDLVAERLLVSLLDEGQQKEWDRNRTFWVETRFGRVQLGQLYSIPFHPRSGPPLRLCVVPDEHLSLPRCDIWTNLLLVLRGDPRQFFDVANWTDGNDDHWHVGPVPLALSATTG